MHYSCALVSMSGVIENPSVNTTMHEFLRSALYVIVGLTFVVAFLISSGRVAIATLVHFQDEISNQVQGMGWTVTNSRGEWRGINPSLQVEHIEFPIGSAHAIDVEIDIIHSLIHNQLVARRLIIEDIQLDLDLTQSPAGQLNYLDVIEELRREFEIIRHSDEVDVRISLTIHREDKSETWQAQVQGATVDQIHRFKVSLSTPESPQTQAIYRFEAVDPILWLHEGDYDMSVEISNLKIDTHLLTGQENLANPVVNAQGSWHRHDGIVKGLIDSSIETQDSNPVHVSVPLTLYQQPGQPLILRAANPTITTTNPVQSLPDLLLGLTMDQITGLVHNLAIEDMMVPVQSLLASNTNVVSWIAGLDTQAKFKRFEFLLDQDGWYWFATAEDVLFNDHMRFPEISASQLSVVGTTTQMLANFEHSKSRVHAPKLFTHGWDFDSLTGYLVLHRSPQLVGISTWQMTGHTASPEIVGIPRYITESSETASDESERYIVQEFLSEPVDLNFRISIQRALGGPADFLTSVLADLGGTLLPLNQTPPFFPLAFESDLNEWRETYLRSANFFNTQLSLVSNTDDLNPDNTVRYQLDGRFTNTTISFDPAWPQIQNASGSIHVDENLASMYIDTATTLETLLVNLMADFPLDADDEYEVAFNLDLDAQFLLDYIQASELKDLLASAHPSWVGIGMVNIDARLRFPYQAETVIDSATNQIELTFEDLDLDLVDLHLEFNDLEGSATWNYPYQVSGQIDSGQFFEHPLAMEIESTVQDELNTINLSLESDITYQQVIQMVEADDPEIGHGLFNFNANLVFYPGTNRDTELLVSSDLEGLTINLPQPIGKAPEETTPTFLQATFSEAFTTLEAQNFVMSAHLVFTEDEQTRLKEGMVTVGSGFAMPPSQEDILIVTGALDQWTYSNEQIAELDVKTEFRNLNIKELGVANLPLTDVTVNGHLTPLTIDIQVLANEFQGIVEKEKDQNHMNIRADFFRWELAEGEVDPLDVADMDQFESAIVQIDQLLLKGADDEDFEDWGAWQLTVNPRPQDDAIVIEDLSIELHGARITNLSPIWWYGNSDTTRLHGELSGENVAETLVGLGNTASVETDQFEVEFDLTWPGSPLALDYETFTGEIKGTADSGRFIDIEQGSGAMRLFGLLNFSKVLNRLALDFQDILLPGLHFDTLTLDTQVNEGVVTFNTPLRVKGPGSDLSLNGMIDTKLGTIDASLTVILPLNKGLQAWATYLAMINPVAGIGLFIGAEEFDRQINKLVSGNYEISGTLDDPVVILENVSDTEQSQN